MIFTTNKRLIKTNEIPLQYVESPVMTFSNKYRNFASQTRIDAQNNSNVDSSGDKKTTLSNANTPMKKTMKWGEPTWFMFHTLAEKIKPEYFQEIRMDLLNIIYTICTNLPCPDCARQSCRFRQSESDTPPSARYSRRGSSIRRCCRIR